MLKPALALALAAAALAVVQPAHAGTDLRDVSIKPSDSPYAAPPRIAVKWEHGRLVVSDDAVRIPVSIGGYVKNLSTKYEISLANVSVESVFGKGRNYSLMPRNSSAFDGVRSIAGNRTLYFSRNNLGPLVKQALDTCRGYHGAGQKSFPLSFPLALHVSAGKKYYGGHKDNVVKDAYTDIKGEVMCPGEPQRTKPAPVRTAPKLTVLSADLAIVNGVSKSCPKKIFMVATFETNRAGNSSSCFAAATARRSSRP